MGLYTEKVLPRIINVVCAMGEAKELRARVCAGLHGEVVEIGFGSGLNVPYYPAAVTTVHAIEPADLGWKLAGKRLAATRTRVERTGLEADLEGADHPLLHVAREVADHAIGPRLGVAREAEGSLLAGLDLDALGEIDDEIRVRDRSVVGDRQILAGLGRRVDGVERRTPSSRRRPRRDRRRRWGGRGCRRGQQGDDRTADGQLHPPTTVLLGSVALSLSHRASQVEVTGTCRAAAVRRRPGPAPRGPRRRRWP